MRKVDRVVGVLGATPGLNLAMTVRSLLVDEGIHGLAILGPNVFNIEQLRQDSVFL